MKAIVDRLAEFIEQWAQDHASTMLVKNYGFAELVNRISRGKTTVSTQPIPITIPGDGSEAQQIALDDRFNFIFWIRTNGRITFSVSEEDIWGLKETKRQNLDLRIVIAHRNNFGEDVIYNLAQNLPSQITIEGYDLVFLDVAVVDDDHETIHNTELGATNYEKHRFTWNIYALNINVEFIPCTGFVRDSIDINDVLTDEQGNFLTAI